MFEYEFLRAQAAVENRWRLFVPSFDFNRGALFAASVVLAAERPDCDGEADGFTKSYPLLNIPDSAEGLAAFVRKCYDDLRYPIA